MNRRDRPRYVVHHTVRIGTVSEAPLPQADVIDASPSGVLVAFAEPIGLLAGQRLCLSFALPDGALHLMAGVVRVERGDDFRTYVGVTLDARPGDRADLRSDPDPELARWLAWLDGDSTPRSDRRTSRRTPPTSPASEPDEAMSELAARLEGDSRPEAATERAAVSSRFTG